MKHEEMARESKQLIAELMQATACPCCATRFDRAAKIIAGLESALAQVEAETKMWKEVVLDALIVNHIYRKEHDSDPRKALSDLITWETQIALDPKVSSDAAKLVAETLEAAAKVCEELAQNWFSERTPRGAMKNSVERDMGGRACAKAIRSLSPNPTPTTVVPEGLILEVDESLPPDEMHIIKNGVVVERIKVAAPSDGAEGE